MLKINEIIAHNVEKILEQKKMKQNELADAMKISRSTMREIMDGGKVMTPVLQNKIAEEFKREDDGFVYTCLVYYRQQLYG